MSVGALLNRRRERAVANSVIRDPEQHTVMDEHGAVRSVQAADITMPTDELDSIWSAMHLERLARTYWKYLSRVTLGLIRVAYTETERAVVFVTRPFVLLRFYAPEYEMSADRGVVKWRIRDGILVAKPGRGGDGFLELDVQRCPADREGYARAHVEVEIANFYPAIATWIARWFYTQTQSRIHVLVTHGFLRSLARLDLEESAVGRFAVVEPGDADGATPEPGAERGSPQSGRPSTVDRGESAHEVTVGDTPWLAVAGLSVAAAAVGAGLVLRARR
jgi:hypothetical protein